MRSVSAKMLGKSSGSYQQGEATAEEPSYSGSRLERAQSRLDEARESVERARESARERRASRASRRSGDEPQFSAPEDVEQRSSELSGNPFSGSGSQRFRVTRDDIEMQAEVRGESELASPSMLERARQLQV